MSEKYRELKELMEIEQLTFKQIIDEKENVYTAENLFGSKAPSGLAAKDTIEELEKILKRRNKKLDHSQVINYQEIITFQGDYYLVRKDLNLVPLKIYLEKNKVDIRLITEWIKTILAIYDQAQKKDINWPGLILESLWVGPEDELFVVDPELTEKIIPYRTEIQFSLDRASLQPPEVIKGGSWEEESKLYAIASLFYYLITEQPLFEAETKEKLYAKIKKLTPLEPRVMNSVISPELNAVIMNCLEKDRNKRVSSFEKLYSKLNELAQNDKLFASAKEKQEIKEQKEKKEKIFNFKEKGFLFIYRYWRWGLGIAFMAVALIIIFTTNTYQPVVKSNTPPKKVVNYFYDSIKEKKVNLLEEVLKSKHHDHLEKMLIEGHVMEAGKKLFGNQAQQREEDKSSQPDWVFSLENLRIEEVSKEPPKFKATYDFIFARPEGEKVKIPMEDYLIMDRVESKWKIVNLKGSLAQRNFLEKAVNNKNK